MIQIHQINTNSPTDIKRFLEIPYRLYKHNSSWAPPLRVDTQKYLDRQSHPIYLHHEVDFFIAVREQCDVGRIMVMKKKITTERQALFALFECENCLQTSSLLLDKASDWAKQRGAINISGPYRLDFFEGDGLLVNGFEHSQIMDMAPYHLSYYQDLLEKNHFKKELDFTSHQIDVNKFTLPDWLEKLATQVQKDQDLQVRSFQNISEVPTAIILQTLQQSLSQNEDLGNAGTEQILFSIKQRMEKGLVPQFIKVIFHKDVMISAILGFPDFTEAMRECAGEFSPQTFSSATSKPSGLVINGFGILPEYQMKGMNAVLFREIANMVHSTPSLKSVSIVQVTETNNKMQSELHALGIPKTQTSRRYCKNISSTNSLNNSSLSTISQIVQQIAQDFPEHRAFTFLTNGEDQEVHLTLARLDHEAKKIAHELIRRGLEKKRVLLMYPPGLDFIQGFIGCLYARAIAVPCYPVSKGTKERFATIQKNVNAHLVLSNSKSKKVMETQRIQIDTSNWLFSDQITTPQTKESLPNTYGEDIAMIQYTSGSTLFPKGVILTHNNLLHNINIIKDLFKLTPNSRGATWLPPYHDMGLIGTILASLINRVFTVFMSPIDFLRKPTRWLKVISKYRVEISGAPNFAYDLCVDRVRDEDCREIDLSSWRLAFNGAEPIHSETLKRFTEKFSSCGFRKESFYPCYGLAEATLIVSGEQPPLIHTYTLANGQQKEFVGGKVPRDIEVCIYDPTTQKICAEEVVGEIYVKSDSVSQGYWNNKQATQEVFAQKINNSDGWLKTGDLGFIKGDELYITGRSKNLIIIRGKNYYPHDLETTAGSSHQALQKNAIAAFSTNIDNEEQIVIACELQIQHRNANTEEVATAIRGALSQIYQLDIYSIVFVKPGQIPKTTSGKIQHYLCQQKFTEGTLATVAQSTRTLAVEENEKPKNKPLQEVEQDLRKKLAELLATTEANIDFEQPVKNLGLSSLTGVALINYIEEKYDFEIPVELFFSDRTLRELVIDILNHDSNE